MSSEAGLSFLEQLHAIVLRDCETPGRPLMLGVSSAYEMAIAIRPTCKMWSCRTCAARNAKRWIARIIDGCNTFDANWQMFTVTAHEYHRREKSVKNLRQGWKKLYNRMRRAYGTKNYVKVWELHTDGETFHLHGMTDHQLTQRWVKDSARACGMGYQAEVHRVDNAGQVAGYIAKYFLKSEGVLRDYPEAWPKGLRRIEVSRSWVPWREIDKGELSWELAQSDEWAAWRLDVLARMGYTVLDHANVTNCN